MIRHVRSVIGTFCIYLFLLNITVSDSSSVVLKLETPEGQIIDDCENWEFQCKNGRCIAKAFVCDGLLDCSDGSDETQIQCQNITCDERYFQCHYGACINKTYRCDGLKQCVDGSDESAQICDITDEKSIRIERDTVKSCAIPSPSLDKIVTFHCADNTPHDCDPENGYVPDLTIASIKCAPGYDALIEKEEEEEKTEHICHNKKWRPKIQQCSKICDKLNSVNVDLRCFRHGINLPCDENTMILEGTTIRPSCKPAHKYSGDSPPTYLEMTCNSEGKWDNALFSCIPECGRTYTNPELLIKGGTLERFGDSPWHVAIYNHQKVLICGGTIITPHLIISAAHCFIEEGSSAYSNSNNASDYEVVVGKVTRNYDIRDNKFQKTYKIKNIRFSDKGFFGVSNGFQADIAILILQEKLDISSAILPACIDWVALRDGIYPTEDTLGKVVGWGINDHGNYSEHLATVHLPFLSHKRCLETVPEDFRRFVTFDKFCAGFENGPGVLQGDSGGGLLFKQNNRYYLQGIVSLKESSLTGIAAFTDMAEHIGWISNVRNEVEKELIRITTPSHQTHHETTKATPTLDMGVKFPQSTPKVRLPTTPTTAPQSTATITLPTKKSATAIAQQSRCKL